jgi:DNA replication protein DnaC
VAPDNLDALAASRMKRIVDRRLATLGSGSMRRGSPGTGKTHIASAIGAGLIDDGYRVLFARTTDLV